MRDDGDHNHPVRVNDLIVDAKRIDLPQEAARISGSGIGPVAVDAVGFRVQREAVDRLLEERGPSGPLKDTLCAEGDLYLIRRRTSAQGLRRPSRMSSRPASIAGLVWGSRSASSQARYDGATISGAVGEGRVRSLLEGLDFSVTDRRSWQVKVSVGMSRAESLERSYWRHLTARLSPRACRGHAAPGIPQPCLCSTAAQVHGRTAAQLTLTAASAHRSPSRRTEDGDGMQAA